MQYNKICIKYFRFEYVPLKEFGPIYPHSQAQNFASGLI